jgi:serine/threonine protein kinase
MPTCKECDSTVAESDVFCPFCGLHLGVHQPEPAPEVEIESTIMMTPDEIAELAQAETPSEGPTAEQVVLDSEKEVGDAAADLAGLPDDPFDGLDSTAFSDIPVPGILSDSMDTSGNVQTRNTSEYQREDAASFAPSRLAEDQVSADPEPAETPAPEAEPSDEAIAAPADAPPPEPAEEDLEFQQTLISAPLPSVREFDRALDEPAPETSVDPRPAEDSMIAIPDEALEIEDNSSSSMFDSVRIIEGQLPFEQDNVATRVPDLGIGATSAANEPKPMTEPNIGKSDTDGRRSAKLKPLSEGTLLNGRYEIVRKIGGGGMGAVYLASDNNLGGVLRAVKEMVQAHIEDDQQEKAINDFKRESMILSTLDHPSIPTIFDYFYDEEESRFYLVMKYISGGDLASRLRATPEGKIDERTVTEWALQVTEVLEYLHNQPSTIVYRDLKPSNIMIDGNSGRVMLIDFGIARSISQKEEKGVTAVGTMGYAPPELFSGNVEPRSDIYSLGSTMFHLLTGADPQSNPLLIFDFQKNPRPRQINPRLSDQIERILMRCVEYNAGSRFTDAAELRDVLQKHLEDLRSGAVTYGTGAAPVSVSLSNQQVFCGFCGQRIVATDLFCAFCGAKQPIAQHGVHSEIYAKPSSATAKLLIEGTSELAAPAYTITKDENLVGRRDPMSNIFPEVDLSKYDPQTKISRRHARIWRDGQAFLVEDLGSSNGTILTPTLKDPFRLVPHKPHALSSGDKIKIGDTTLHFVVN